MKDSLKHLFDFVENGVSPFHAVAWARRVLEENGFEELRLKDNWALEKGGRYFVIPFGTTLYAFTVGAVQGVTGGVRMAGAHTDTPVLKLKPHPEIIRHGYLQLNTEVYGGPILNTWFDRPLSLAGRVAVRGGNGVEARLADLKRPCAYLPNLAVHMNRGINENGKPIQNQKELLPILMMTDLKEPENAFRDLLAGEIGAEPGDILDWDLCVYNPEKPKTVGWRDEFVASPRLDDLDSCAALIHGLASGGGRDGLNMVCLFDNEEVGSRSKQGADSEMPLLVLSKIFRAFGMDRTEALSHTADGLMISVDVAHAWHPNYPEVQDITNYPVPGGGFVFKSAANQSFAWDALALAEAEEICISAGIAFQRFAKHSDTKGGGTIGSIISSHLPMRTVDMGIGLLAMHSACEMQSKEDQESLERFAKAFFA